VSELEPPAPAAVLAAAGAAPAVTHAATSERSLHAEPRPSARVESTSSTAARPDIAPAEVTVTPRFIMVVPSLATSTAALATSGQMAPLGSSEAAPVSESRVDKPARLLRGLPPAYTAAARDAGIEANLLLELVVDSRGRVQSVKALSHLGYGLDEVALEAARSSRFAPARRAGNAVAVRMRWWVQFKLQ